jgi:hypothetical protein
LVRDGSTLLLYAILGIVGFLLNGLGAILGPLRRQLDVDRSDVAFYPSLFALALVVVGLVGGSIVSRVGHRPALIGSLVGMIAGPLLLAAPERPVTLVGAALLGAGAAFSVQVVPSALTRRHPLDAAPAIGEANAVSSTASVIAPAAVAAAIALGAGWRTGYLLPSLPVAAFLLFVVVTRFRAAPARLSPDAEAMEEVPVPATGSGYEAGPLLGRWVDVVAAVSVEFCLVFWAADAFDEWYGAGDAAAPALAALFLAGMALVRIFAATVDRWPASCPHRPRGLRGRRARLPRFLGVAGRGARSGRVVRGRGGRRPALPRDGGPAGRGLAAPAGRRRRARGARLRSRNRDRTPRPGAAGRSDGTADGIPRGAGDPRRAGRPRRLRAHPPCSGPLTACSV